MAKPWVTTLLGLPFYIYTTPLIIFDIKLILAGLNPLYTDTEFEYKQIDSLL